MAFFLLWNTKEDIWNQCDFLQSIFFVFPRRKSYRIRKTSSVSAVVFRNQVPLLLTAQFVGCVLIPITCEVQLTRKDVYSVANKQILWMKLIKLGPP